MEFLMTYGWAILVVLCAVGILTYLGLFDQGDRQAEDKELQQFCEEFCKQEGYECSHYTFDHKVLCTVEAPSDFNVTPIIEYRIKQNE